MKLKQLIFSEFKVIMKITLTSFLEIKLIKIGKVILDKIKLKKAKEFKIFKEIYRGNKINHSYQTL